MRKRVLEQGIRNINKNCYYYNINASLSTIFINKITQKITDPKYQSTFKIYSNKTQQMTLVPELSDSCIEKLAFCDFISNYLKLLEFANLLQFDKPKSH